MRSIALHTLSSDSDRSVISSFSPCCTFLLSEPSFSDAFAEADQHVVDIPIFHSPFAGISSDPADIVHLQLYMYVRKPSWQADSALLVG